MSNIQTQIVNSIQTALATLNIPVGGEIKLEHPANPEHGEWSSNVALISFKNQAAAVLGTVSGGLKDTVPVFSNPRALAQGIVDEIQQALSGDTAPQITKIEVAGPGFINFYVTDEVYVTEMASIIEKQAKLNVEQHVGKLAIVEFSSPNIAKPFTIGHLRSTIIGAAIANLLEVVGYSVLRDNHLGDWGTQFGKQIYALKHLGEGSLEKNLEKIEQADKPVKELVALYVEFHEEAEADPTLEDKAREWFAKLENGDQEARELWQKCIDWSWVEFSRIYGQLGVSFSAEFDQGRGLGESFFEDKMDRVITELEQHPEMYRTGENGAKLFFYPEEKFPPLMILKKDGATLYATRDLATDKFRKEQYNPDLIVNEVGAEQALYFRQIFEIEYLLGWFKPTQRVHVKHGLYRFKDKKMSTRKGNVIWLEDVLAEAIDRAAKLGDEKAIDSRQESTSTELKAKTKDLITKNSAAIGIGALKWNDLRRSSELDIVFDWDEMLSMEGNSGPYMQYVYVRTLSILKKFKQLCDNNGIIIDKITEPKGGDSTYSPNEEEITLLRKLSRYNEAIQLAASEYAPHHLCTYLYELAQAFNSFYNKHSVLGELAGERGLGSEERGEEIRQEAQGTSSTLSDQTVLRIGLVKATQLVIGEGLRILGIQVVEEM